MDANNPLIADDIQTDEVKLEKDRMLKSYGIKAGELSDEEIDDLSDEINSDTNPLQDSDDASSDVVMPEENHSDD